jgi:hypothetical protein
VVVTSDVVAAISAGDVAFELIGRTELKGLVAPVQLHRAIRAER